MSFLNPALLRHLPAAAEFLGPAPKLELLAKHVGLKSHNLTPAIAREIASGLGYEVQMDDALFSQIVGTLREAAVDNLADILGQPAILPKLVGFFMKQPPTAAASEKFVACGHCGKPYLWQRKQDGDSLSSCPHCRKFNFHTE